MKTVCRLRGCRRPRSFPLGIIVPLLAILWTTVAADADDPAGVVRTIHIEAAPTVESVVRSNCWDDAPAGARVLCAAAKPEHQGSLTLSLQSTSASSTDIVIGYQTRDITATAGEDYVALSGSFTIPANATRTSFAEIEFIDDLVEEGTETFVVEFTAPPDIGFVDYVHLTILDEESYKISITDGSRTEGAQWMRYSIVASPPLPWSMTVSLRFVDGTAIGCAPPTGQPRCDGDFHNFWGGVDTYTNRSGSWSRASFEHLLFDDAIDEPDETYTIRLEDPRYVAIDDGEGVMTILDDDDPPSVSAADASGYEDAGELSFRVALSSQSGKEATVDYETRDLDATAGEDYESVAGSLTFAPGERVKTVTVTVNADDTHEPDEEFELALFNARNATRAYGADGIGTIRNDDPELRIGDAPWKWEDADALTFRVVATDLVTAGQSVTVKYATKDGTATAGEDYEHTEGTLRFTPSDATKTITVPLIDDIAYEGHEMVSVELSDPTGAVITRGTAEALIRDDDRPSRAILLTTTPERVDEDDGPTRVRVTATLDRGARTDATTVAVSVRGSGDEHAVDFEDVPDFTITIDARAKSATRPFTLTPIDDGLDESTEILTVDGTSDLPVESTEVELLDDEATSSTIALTADPPRVFEDGGPASVEVTATLDAGARTVATTVGVTVSASGRADAVDFAAVPDFEITIAAGDGSGSGTFTLSPEDDDLDESDETVAIDGSSVLEVTSDAVTLVDDDASSTAIVLAATPPLIGEEAGATPVTVTATLDASARTVATTVAVSVADSGQPGAVGYGVTSTAFEVVIDAGATMGTETFTVTPEDDDVDEIDETLDLTGTSDLAVTPTSVTLADDERTSTEILLSAVPATVSEGAGATPVEVTARLDAGARTEATTITVQAAASGDAGAVDFAAVPDFSIVIGAGMLTGRETFTLTPEQDNVVETSETLTLAGTADIPVTDASVTITDDDVASSGIALSVQPDRWSEDGGSTAVKVTASLNGSARQEATTVTVSVAGSGDPLAVDFQAVADFAITIAAAATSGEGTFTLVPENDRTEEVEETLTVSGVSDLPVTSATLVLTDDEVASQQILLAAVPGRVTEGDGPTPVTVTATLDRALRQRATLVTVSVMGGGNPDAVDFAPVPDFEITIAANAGSGTGTFTLTPEDDSTGELDETLTVSAVSDLPVTSAAVRLVDDDEVSTSVLLYLAADPPRASEGDGAIRVTVTAALDKGTRPVETRVAVSVAGSGRSDAVDFDAVGSFEVVIAANAPDGTGTFTLVPEDDMVVEVDEILTVSGVSDLPVTSATLELLDDDEPSRRILLTAEPARVSEGDGPVPVTVTASLDRGLRPEATTVTVSVAASGNPHAVDFDPVADFVVAIAANASSGRGTFELAPEDDVEDEADETLTLTGESNLPVTSASVVLVDDDEVVDRVLSVADAEAAEGAGEVVFTLTLDGPSTAVVTVDFATSDPGTADPVATPVVDYASAAGTLTFAPGELTRSVAVAVVDDDVNEPDEVFALVLANPQGAALDRATALGTIVDDDGAVDPVLSVADVNAAEGAGELLFVVSLDGPSGTAVKVDYATADPGTADPVATAAVDYASVSGTLTFPPGELARTIRVSVIDDDVDEPDEAFALSLTNPQGATLDRPTALGTILDDDDPPALNIGDATGAEDVGELGFAVSLTAESTSRVEVSYATMDVTAEAGDDYRAVGGTLSFMPGETVKTIGVPVVDDVLDETDEETFVVMLSAVSAAATIADGSATGTIVDNDEPPVVSVADAAGDEDVGALEFAVTLDLPSGTEVSFSYATQDGTAEAGSDYIATAGTVTLARGEQTHAIRVRIIDDSVDERDEETFSISLSALENATAMAGSATGTIRDDDLAPPVVAGQLAVAMLCVGGAPYELDLDDQFQGEDMRFSAVSAAPGVAAVALVGNRLSIAPTSEGETAVTVTATNPAGSVDGMIRVRVVTDPLEFEAVESALASIGRGILTGVIGSVGARFADRGDPGSVVSGQHGTTSAPGIRDRAVPDAAIAWNRWTGTSGRVGQSHRWNETFSRSGYPNDRRIGTASPPSMVPFSFLLDSARTDGKGSGWTVWGRGSAHRFQWGNETSSHDGSLGAVYVGADVGAGDWLAGVSLARASATADYRFERSVDACGGGMGEGLIEAEVTSVLPYAGRRIGAGWVWATLGAGSGDGSVERCETVHRSDADLTMRLAAVGGRHPFSGGERFDVSVVEEVGVLRLTTGDAVGPAGERALSVGQARLGLEVSGKAPPGCMHSVATFVRAFARGDWGDGATGAGLELAAGVRYRNRPWRLGIDASVRTLAVHAEEDVEDRSADLTLSILPADDGTGLQASLVWRQESAGLRPYSLGGISPWTVRTGGIEDRQGRRVMASRLGYGIATGRGRVDRRGIVVPFLEYGGTSDRGIGRLGVRHQFDGLAIEWAIGKSDARLGGGAPRFVLMAAGSF